MQNKISLHREGFGLDLNAVSYRVVKLLVLQAIVLCSVFLGLGPLRSESATAGDFGLRKLVNRAWPILSSKPESCGTKLTELSLNPKERFTDDFSALLSIRADRHLDFDSLSEEPNQDPSKPSEKDFWTLLVMRGAGRHVSVHRDILGEEVIRFSVPIHPIHSKIQSKNRYLLLNLEYRLIKEQRFPDQNRMQRRHARLSRASLENEQGSLKRINIDLDDNSLVSRVKVIAHSGQFTKVSFFPKNADEEDIKVDSLLSPLHGLPNVISGSILDRYFSVMRVAERVTGGFKGMRKVNLVEDLQSLRTVEELKKLEDYYFENIVRKDTGSFVSKYWRARLIFMAIFGTVFWGGEHIWDMGKQAASSVRALIERNAAEIKYEDMQKVFQELDMVELRDGRREFSVRVFQGPSKSISMQPLRSRDHARSEEILEGLAERAGGLGMWFPLEVENGDHDFMIRARLEKVGQGGQEIYQIEVPEVAADEASAREAAQ